MTYEEFVVIEAMSNYGESFVKALAECFYRANTNNFTKLKDAFPDYWYQYKEMAAKDKQKNESI